MTKPSNPKLFPVQDYGNEHVVFADDLVAIDDLGPVTHLIFAMAKRDVDADRRGGRVVVARIVIPTVLRAQILRQLSEAAAGIQTMDDNPRELQAVH